MTDAKKPTGLDLMRVPFEPNQISKLPKPTKAQTDEVRQNFKAGIRCEECGGWHHPKVVHLDYVGHAALTDRLLDCDPEWNWEPVTETGLPMLDRDGGMWIKLTVCGVTRLGYGHADGKTGGNATKEVIGDALRNAAMRFGAALDLWHKGDLHGHDESQPDNEPVTDEDREKEMPPFNSAAARDRIKSRAEKAKTLADLQEVWDGEKETLKIVDEPHFKELKTAFAAKKAELTPPDPAMQAPDNAHEFE